MSLTAPAGNTHAAGPRPEGPAACSPGDHGTQTVPTDGPRPRAPIADSRAIPRAIGPQTASGMQDECSQSQQGIAIESTSQVKNGGSEAGHETSGVQAYRQLEQAA
jgi:hypothetical protein